MASATDSRDASLCLDKERTVSSNDCKRKHARSASPDPEVRRVMKRCCVRPPPLDLHTIRRRLMPKIKVAEPLLSPVSCLSPAPQDSSSSFSESGAFSPGGNGDESECSTPKGKKYEIPEPVLPSAPKKPQLYRNRRRRCVGAIFQLRDEDFEHYFAPHRL